MAFVLKEIVGLKFRQIAHIMEKSETGLRKELSRSREKMRRHLQNHCVLYNPKGGCNCRIKKMYWK